MRTRFIDILEGAADLAGLVPDVSLTTEHARTLTRGINRALGEASEQEFIWPQLERCEERFLTVDWSPEETYAVGAIVTDIDADGAVSYFECIQAITDPHSTLLGEEIAGSTNDGTSFDYERLNPTRVPVVGDTVATGSAGPLYLREVTEVTGLGGDFYRITVSEEGAGPATPAVNVWLFLRPHEETDYWTELESRPAIVKFNEEGETEIAAVISVHDEDPRGKRRAPERAFRLTGGTYGLQIEVGTDAPDSVWVRFRRVVHEVTTTVYSGSVAYVLGSIVYVPVVSGGTPTANAGKGDCYRALGSTTNNAPVTNGVVHASWERVEIPANWRRFLQYRPASDFLAIENSDQAKIYRIEAESALKTAMADVAIAQQQQEGYQGSQSAA